MCKFSYTPNELVTVARMSHTPILIVEGYDDIQIYEDIADSINKKVYVYASENLGSISNRIYTKIKNINWTYTYNNSNLLTVPLVKSHYFGRSGCQGVLESLAEIDIHSKISNYDDYILGIIDKDVTDYRETVDPNTKGLLVLNYYSIESHFITYEHLDKVIKSLTSASNSIITENLKIKIFENVMTNLKKLYYISLDALKNACVSNYNNTAKYSDNNARDILFNPMKYAEIMNKKEDLDNFAEVNNINQTLEDLLRIAKGKWIIDYFVFLLRGEINKLQDYCKNNEIVKCQFCNQNKFNQCLYKTKSYDETYVKNLLFSDISISSLNDIKIRIGDLVS